MRIWSGGWRAHPGGVGAVGTRSFSLTARKNEMREVQEGLLVAARPTPLEWATRAQAGRLRHETREKYGFLRHGWLWCSLLSVERVFMGRARYAHGFENGTAADDGACAFFARGRWGTVCAADRRQRVQRECQSHGVEVCRDRHDATGQGAGRFGIQGGEHPADDSGR